MLLTELRLGNLVTKSGCQELVLFMTMWRILVPKEEYRLYFPIFFPQQIFLAEVYCTQCKTQSDKGDSNNMKKDSKNKPILS